MRNNSTVIESKRTVPAGERERKRVSDSKHTLSKLQSVSEVCGLQCIVVYALLRMCICCNCACVCPYKCIFTHSVSEYGGFRFFYISLVFVLFMLLSIFLCIGLLVVFLLLWFIMLSSVSARPCTCMCAPTEWTSACISINNVFNNNLFLFFSRKNEFFSLCMSHRCVYVLF